LSRRGQPRQKRNKTRKEQDRDGRLNLKPAAKKRSYGKYQPYRGIPGI
jgi:hypothetical protein